MVKHYSYSTQMRNNLTKVFFTNFSSSVIPSVQLTGVSEIKLHNHIRMNDETPFYPWYKTSFYQEEPTINLKICTVILLNVLIRYTCHAGFRRYLLKTKEQDT